MFHRSWHLERKNKTVLLTLKLHIMKQLRGMEPLYIFWEFRALCIYVWKKPLQFRTAFLKHPLPSAARKKIKNEHWSYQRQSVILLSSPAWVQSHPRRRFRIGNWNPLFNVTNLASIEISTILRTQIPEAPSNQPTRRSMISEVSIICCEHRASLHTLIRICFSSYMWTEGWLDGNFIMILTLLSFSISSSFLVVLVWFC